MQSFVAARCNFANVAEYTKCTRNASNAACVRIAKRDGEGLHWTTLYWSIKSRVKELTLCPHNGSDHDLIALQNTNDLKIAKTDTAVVRDRQIAIKSLRLSESFLPSALPPNFLIGINYALSVYICLFDEAYLLDSV